MSARRVQVVAPKESASSQARRRREAEDQARRAFLRAASHELRTPLNAIIGFSEIIARELHGPIGEPRYREHAEVVRDSGRRLLKLVNQTLEIARLEAGAADLQVRPEALDLAFAEAERAVEPALAHRNLSLDSSIGPGAARVMADNRGLNTVLVTLIETAAQFSPTGGAVRLRARAACGDVCIEVDDDGPSVSPNDLHRLLRPFQHGEETPQRGGEGYGLGLAVVNLTCKAMGGSVRLHSGAHGGMTASVRLPAA